MRLTQLLVILLTCLAGSVFAQETTVYTEANRTYKEAEEYFNQGLYGVAQRTFEEAITLLRPSNEPRYELLRVKSELGYAKSAVRRDLPEAEQLMLNFIREHSPGPLANRALVEVANYYYNAKKYDQALEYFERIPTYQLSRSERAEVKFKMGYANFVKKKFAQAKGHFDEVKEYSNSEYYYPTNYYLAMIAFYDGDYDAALRGFRLVEKSRQYERDVPYYIAQILFAEKKYDELIAYAEPYARAASIRKAKEMNQLVGQAYFEKGNYAAALPYLEAYANMMGRLTETEWYQLGYAQYQQQKYEAAAESFSRLDNTESEMGQFAAYYIGDSYLKLDDKQNARGAFGRASRMAFDADIQQEALINYAKLSYELQFDREAITALQSIRPGSKYYNESQRIMADIFLNTRDYERALGILESVPNKTPELKEAYQKVSFYRALQEYQAGRTQEAKRLLQKSINVPIDPSVRAQATYWLGTIAHDERDYQQSIQLMNQFLTLAKPLRNLPDESSVFTANYTNGYNYLKLEDYNTALNYFQDAVAGIKRNKGFIQSEFVKGNVLGDATVRAGDALFKRNRYNDAAKFYDEAIERRYSGFVYALYQKAIIEGLRGSAADKLLALESIVSSYPRSDFADDALYEMGKTYQQQRQFNEAIKPLQRLVRDYKGKSDLVNPALLRLGLITYNQGSYNTAINYYKQVFAGNPTAEEAQTALTALEQIYVNDLGDPDGYFTFLETVPGYQVGNFSRDSINFRAAEVQFENANYDKAVLALTEYLNKFPRGANRLQALYYRGDSYFALKQYTPALNDYDAVIGAGQSRYYAKALEKAALLAYNHSEDFTKSYEYYSRLAQVAGNAEQEFAAALGAMRSAYRSGQTQAAAQWANQVRDNPNATADNRAFANFYLGKLAYDTKQYSDARTSLTEVISVKPESEIAAESRYLLANMLYQQQRLDEANTFANNSIGPNGAYPYWVAKTLILISDISRDQGDIFSARGALEAVIENFDGDPELVQEARQKLAQLDTESNRRIAPDEFDTNNFLEDPNGN